MLYQGWKDTIGQPTVYQHGRRQVLTKCWTKTSLKDVFIVKIFFEIIFSCDIMFEDKR